MSSEKMVKSVRPLMCPSAEPEMEGSVIFGIVGGTPEQPKMTHLKETKQIPAALLELDSPVKPTEVFRIAAKCESSCLHFDGSQCRLSQRIVDGLPPVAEALPPCPIRNSCRWWHQNGKEACFRCTQIIRDNYIASEELRQSVDPFVYEPEQSIHN
jgi:hypothetical protein